MTREGPRQIADHARIFIRVAAALVAALGVYSAAKGVRLVGVESDNWTKLVTGVFFFAVSPGMGLMGVSLT